MEKFNLELINIFLLKVVTIFSRLPFFMLKHKRRGDVSITPPSTPASPQVEEHLEFMHHGQSLFLFYILLKFIAPRSAIGLIISKLFSVSPSPYPLAFVRYLYAYAIYLSLHFCLVSFDFLNSCVCVAKIGEKMRLEAEREGRREGKGQILYDWSAESGYRRMLIIDTVDMQIID